MVDKHPEVARPRWHCHLASNLAEKSARFSSVVLKHPGSALAKAEDWRRHVLEVGNSCRPLVLCPNVFGMIDGTLILCLSASILQKKRYSGDILLVKMRSNCCPRNEFFVLFPLSQACNRLTRVRILFPCVNYLIITLIPFLLKVVNDCSAGGWIFMPWHESSTTLLFSFLKSWMTEIMYTGHGRCSTCGV
jgi:hypothetical protein